MLAMRAPLPSDNICFVMVSTNLYDRAHTTPFQLPLFTLLPVGLDKLTINLFLMLGYDPNLAYIVGGLALKACSPRRAWRNLSIVKANGEAFSRVHVGSVRML